MSYNPKAYSVSYLFIPLSHAYQIGSIQAMCDQRKENSHGTKHKNPDTVLLKTK